MNPEARKARISQAAVGALLASKVPPGWKTLPSERDLEELVNFLAWRIHQVGPIRVDRIALERPDLRFQADWLQANPHMVEVYARLFSASFPGRRLGEMEGLEL